MADPNSLESKTPANTFNDLIHINNSNVGLDATSRLLYSGNGVATTVSMSSTKFSADCNYGELTNPTLVSPTNKLGANIIVTIPLTADFDLSTSNHFTINLIGDNVTSTSFSNVPTGATEVFITIIQSGGTNTWTVAWGSEIKWPAATPPVITTGTGKSDLIRLYTNNSGTTWYGSIISQNYDVTP